MAESHENEHTESDPRSPTSEAGALTLNFETLLDYILENNSNYIF